MKIKVTVISIIVFTIIAYKTDFLFSENTLFYFFSTLSQSFAALVAFFFTAAQMKISWLDEKITTNKKAILYCYTGRSHWTVNKVDAQMCKMSANEVLKKGKEIDQHGSAEIAVQLEKFLYQIRDLRESVRRFILVGLTLTAIGIVGILFAKDFSMNVYFGLFIMMFIFPAIVVCLYFMCQFIYKSLEVSKKSEKKIER